MAFGLFIQNDAGTIQIDESFSNLALAQKVTGTTVANESATWSGSKITLSFAGSFPMIAWQCGSLVMMQGFSWTGGAWNFVMRCAGAVGTAYTLFVFAETSPTENYGSMGREVWDASGVRVFHSGAKQARIAGSHTTGFPGTADIAYTSGREYATAMLRPAVRRHLLNAGVGPPFPVPFYILHTFSGCRGYAGGVSAGSWGVNQAGPYPGSTPFTPLDQSASQFLVLDVTHY